MFGKSGKTCKQSDAAEDKSYDNEDGEPSGVLIAVGDIKGTSFSSMEPSNLMGLTKGFFLLNLFLSNL